MKAIHCREWGTPDTLRLEEAESPSLSPDEVRIRVRAAGINFADTLMIAGSYQVKRPFPFIPGLEAAGEVIELGSGHCHVNELSPPSFVPVPRNRGRTTGTPSVSRSRAARHRPSEHTMTP